MTDEATGDQTLPLLQYALVVERRPNRLDFLIGLPTQTLFTQAHIQVFRSTVNNFAGATRLQFPGDFPLAGVDAPVIRTAGMQPNTTYYYWFGLTSPSDPNTSEARHLLVVETTPATTLPAFPTTTVTASTGPTGIVVTWNPPMPANGQVLIQRSHGTGVPFRPAAIRLGSLSSSFTDTTVVPGESYEYYLHFNSITTRGFGVYTSEVTVGTLAAGSAPLISETTHSSVEISWSAPSSIPPNTSVTVWRGTSLSFSSASVIASNLPASTTEYTFTGLDASTQYYFWYAYVSGTESRRRGPVGGITSAEPAPAPTPPPVPTGTAANPIDHDTIQVVWQRPAGLSPTATLTLRRAIGGAGDIADSTIYRTGLTGTFFDDNGLQPQTQYWYWLSFVDNGVEGPNIRRAGTTSAAPATFVTNPTGVTAVALDHDSIRVNWVRPSGLPANTTATIYRGTNINFSQASEIASGLTGTTYTNNGLASVTIYYYWVRLVAPGASDSQAIRASATTPPQPLTRIPDPINLAVQILTDNSARVSWQKTSNTPVSTTARIWHSTFPTLSTATSIASGIIGSSYTATGLPAGTDQYFWVEIESNMIIDSNPVRISFQTPDTSQPLFPASPQTVTAVALDHDSIRVNWVRPSGLPANTTATIWRSTSISLTSAVTVQSGLTGTTYTNNGLSSSTRYYFWVQFVAPGYEDSGRVRTTAITSAAQVTPVPDPLNVQAVVLDHNSIRIQWQRPSALPANTTATVLLSLTPNFSSAVVFEDGLTGTSWTWNLAQPSSSYWMWVRLEAPNNDDSNPIRVAAMTPAAPVNQVANPTNVTATVLDSDSIRINWFRPSELPSGTTARIWQNTSSSFSSAASVVSNLTGTSYTIHGLSSDTNYWFWVELEASGIDDSDPIRASARTAPDVVPTPPAPSNVAAVAVDDSSIQLSWIRPSNLESTASLTIRRAVGGDGDFSDSSIIIVGRTGTSYANTGLNANTQYWYWLSFVDRGTEGPRVRVTATTDATPQITIPAPTDVTATVLNSENIRINWTRPTGTPTNATATIRRGSTTAFSQSVSVATGLTGQSFTNSGLSASTLYYYWVFFTDGTDSGSSIRVSATTSTATIPVPPEPDNLRITTRTTTAIQIEWDEPSGLPTAARATVRFGTTNSFASSTAAITGTTLTSYLISGLQQSTTYYIWVFYQIVNTAGTASMITASTRSVVVIPVGLTAPSNAWGFDTRPSIASLGGPSETNVWYDGYPDNDNSETIYQSQRQIKGTPSIGATMNDDGTSFGDWTQPVRIRGPVSTATSAYTIIADPAVSFVSNGNTTTVTVSVSGPETASIVYTFLGTPSGVSLQANPVQTGTGHFAHTIDPGLSTRMSVVYSASSGSATLASTTFRVDLFRTVQSGGTVRVEIGDQQIDLGVSTG